MPSQNLMVMQSAVNRIAVASNGFVSKIPVDGGMGPMTASQTFQALVWVAQKNCSAFNRCVPDAFADSANILIAAIVNGAGETDQTAIMQRNVDIARCLNGAADVLGVAASPMPSAGGGGGGGGAIVTTPIKNAFESFKSSGTIATIKASFQKLQPWQKAVVGGLAVLGTIFAFKKISKAKANG